LFFIPIAIGSHTLPECIVQAGLPDYIIQAGLPDYIIQAGVIRASPFVFATGFRSCSFHKV